MDTNYTIGLFSMLGIILVARILNERALRKLDKEKKVELLDLFSGRRIYSFIALIVILALFYAGIKFEVVPPLVNVVIFVCLIALHILFSGLSSYRVLKNNDFPEFYITNYLLTTSLRIVSLVIFFLFMTL